MAAADDDAEVIAAHKIRSNYGKTKIDIVQTLGRIGNLSRKPYAARIGRSETAKRNV